MHATYNIVGLPGLSPSSPLSSNPGSHYTDLCSHTIVCKLRMTTFPQELHVLYLLHCLGDKPKLKDVLKMLLPLASDWKTIGALLGAEEGVLAKIKHDEQEANDRIQEVISWWLKQVDPSPTWKALADAVESVNPEIASDIRQRCIDI